MDADADMLLGDRDGYHVMIKRKMEIVCLSCYHCGYQECSRAVEIFKYTDCRVENHNPGYIVEKFFARVYLPFQKPPNIAQSCWYPLFPFVFPESHATRAKLEMHP